MRLSKSGIGTIRVNNLDEMYPAQDMLMQSGQLVQYGAGIFGYNNITMLVKRNIEKIIEECLNDVGCIEAQFPTLQPDTIWKKSGRWDKYVEDGTMLVVESDKGKLCLAPTAEEACIEFMAEKLKSYKHMPVTVYQIGEKYRNEIRTRGYLLRGRSFLMMDAYSFDTDLKGLENSYLSVRKAYLEIGKKLGIQIIPVIADNGSMGGKKSEEFMLISPIGEDTILYDSKSNIALNKEVLEKENYEQYLKDEYGIEDITNLKETKAIEVGHIFQLGTKYSDSMNITYTDKDGKQKPYYMGCYGIGVSRLVATIYENSVIKDENGKVVGISLPKQIAPYKVQIIPKIENENKVKQAEEIYKKLEGRAILDDRKDVTMGAKIKDCKILGTPYMAILGDKVEEGKIELEETKTGEKRIVSIDELITLVN